MSDLFAPDVPVASYETSLEPEEWRSFVYGHENSQRIRWWQAVIDPTYQRVTGRANPGTGATRWLHEEQDVSRFRAVVSDSRNMKRYMPQGVFEIGDLSLVCMPDEIPVGDHDWVMPMGRQAGEAWLLQCKEPLVRGSHQDKLAGVVSSSGTTVTGSGTHFLTDFSGVELIEVNKQAVRVVSVASDTVLTVDQAPSPAWAQNSYVRRRELLSYYPAHSVTDLRDATRRYVHGKDFVLLDGRNIRWLTVNSPANGATMSTVYSYYPRYIVVPSMTLGSHGVGHRPQPILVTLRLAKPDTLQE